LLLVPKAWPTLLKNSLKFIHNFVSKIFGQTDNKRTETKVQLFGVGNSDNNIRIILIIIVRQHTNAILI